MDLRQFLMCLSLCTAFALSKPTEKKDRVHHEPQLSDKVHNDAQSFDYDHDAFLGAEEAKTFDQLTPEESKERLGWVPARRGLVRVMTFLYKPTHSFFPLLSQSPSKAVLNYICWKLTIELLPLKFNLFPHFSIE